MKFLNKLTSTLQKAFRSNLGKLLQPSFSKKILLTLGLFAVFFFWGGDIVLAAKDTNDVQDAFASIAVMVIHLMVYISWIIIGLMGDMLSNDLVMHPNVVPILKLLWTVLRNLVNITFIFVLLFIAFRTIFNFGDGGNDSLKKDLPSVALALVLVNFSWLFMVVIIDASSVLTNVAFSLSDIVEGGTNANYVCDSNSQKRCMQNVYSIQYNKPPKNTGERDQTGVEGKNLNVNNFIYITEYENENDLQKTAKLNGIDYSTGDVYNCGTTGTSTTCPTDQNNCSNSAQNTIKKCGIEKFLKYKKDTAFIHLVTKPYSPADSTSNRSITAMIAKGLLPLEEFVLKSPGTKSFGALIVEVLFSLIMSILIVVAFVALFIVLLIRTAVLWIALIASPLAVFIFFDFIQFKDTIKEYFLKAVHLAFVPAIVGVVFSLTFIIIGQLGYADSSFLLGADGQIVVLENSVMQSGSPLFNFLLSVLVIVFFWMAIFAAMSMDFTRAIVEGISGGVKTAGKWVAERPLHMDIIPIATRADGSVVRGDLSSLGNKLQESLKGDRSDDYAKLRSLQQSELSKGEAESVTKVAGKFSGTLDIRNKDDIKKANDWLRDEKNSGKFAETFRKMNSEKQSEVVRRFIKKTRGESYDAGVTEWKADQEFIQGALGTLKKSVENFKDAFSSVKDTSTKSKIELKLYDEGVATIHSNINVADDDAAKKILKGLGMNDKRQAIIDALKSGTGLDDDGALKGITLP